MTPGVICSAECRRRFVQLPRGFTVLSSMAHRTFYVHFVRIGFGQRLSEPPCIDHVWSISLRFPLFSYIYENQSRGPHRNQRSVSQIMGSPTQHANVVVGRAEAGVAFMAPSAIRCERLAERDLSLSAAFLPQLAALFLSLCRL